MSDADKAYQAAQEMIAQSKAEGGHNLHFDQEETRALTRLPPEIAELTRLRILWLNDTQISDAGLVHLAGLPWLQTLRLNSTKVKDLQPVLDFSAVNPPDGERSLERLYFRDIPALELDDRLAELSEIADEEESTDETLVYLSDKRENWPPLLEGEAQPSPMAEKPDKPGPTLKSSVTRNHIEFLIRTTPVTRSVAGTLADQISSALSEVPAAPGSNQLPDEFQVFEKIRNILRVMATPVKAEGSKDDRIARLEQQLAAFEAQLAELTEQLGNEKARADIAEAKLTRGGFRASHDEELGKNVARLEVVIAGSGLIYGANYFLGPSSETVIRFIEAFILGVIGIPTKVLTDLAK